MLLWERALEARGLWLDRCELLCSGIRERSASIVQTSICKVLLWNAGRLRVLEATILLQARVELVEVLRLLLLVL